MSGNNSSAFDIVSATNITYQTIQTLNINSAIFGGLVVWGLWIFIDAIDIWSKKRDKPIFILNAVQSGLNLFKITSAMSYVVFYGLNCTARGILLNIPQAIAWILIYNMLLIKLLLFTPYKMIAKGFFAVSLVTYFILVCIGVAQTTSTSALGKCSNRYPLLFKQQYTVEMIIEIVTFLMLLHALAHKKSGVMASTNEIFRQLRENENLRMFLVIFFISFKIVLTYQPITAFDALTLTHGIDSARSALVHWALSREQRKIYEAALRARKASLPYNSSEKSNDHSRRPSNLLPLNHSRRPSQGNILGSHGSQNALSKGAATSVVTPGASQIQNTTRVSVVYEKDDIVSDVAQ